MTLNDFINEYLTWSKGVHAPKTLDANSLALRKFSTHVGDHMQLTDIGPRHVDQFMSLQISKGLKPTSVNNYYRHLKAAFGKAETWELIPNNPFTKVRPIRQDKTPPAFIPKDELAAFLKGIEGFELRMLTTAYCATGRRRKELLSLKWTDVDMGRRAYMVKSTKAHLEKEFPINDVFYSVLAQLQTRSDREHVFRQWKPDTVTHKVKNELVRAGYGHMHMHSLRHSFAAAYLMSGGDLFALKELLGHSQIGTTQVYAHLTEGHLSEEANKVRF